MKPTNLILLALPCLGANAWAHGGGLDKEGCHDASKHGGYHCHRAISSAPAGRRHQPAQRLVPSDYVAPAPSAGGHAFANCSEARAAGAAPVRRGEPGYGPHLDRDNDGIGCEPYKER
ncbi:MAG: excalibur calcium-binding domain-containing protein [Burkholderiales bacterium]|nr:MAG: excalibur calcium-binding domain-containing protein [Burkholderiales bacterium]